MPIKRIKIQKRLFFLVVILSCMMAEGIAQSLSAFGHISRDPRFSASNYCIYPDTVLSRQTPPPTGKRPFYISHYGRHGSRYLNNRKGYDVPYQILAKADSADKLTPQGQHVLQQLKEIIDDSEGRWGDLSELGKQQHRGIARRMMIRFLRSLRVRHMLMPRAQSSTVASFLWVPPFRVWWS